VRVTNRGPVRSPATCNRGTSKGFLELGVVAVRPNGGESTVDPMALRSVVLSAVGVGLGLAAFVLAYGPAAQ